MSECEDFRHELSAMEELAEKLSSDSFKVTILVTPKYHCEIAGEGIEYAWGLFKKVYRNLPLDQKRTRSGFRQAVEKSLNDVTVEHARRFSARVRCYMLAYRHFKDKGNTEQTEQHITYDEIEKFVKNSKCHRSVLDQDAGFIANVWRESQVTENSS